MARRPVPDKAPRFGYCLEVGGRIVGVVLLIASERQVDGQAAVFCNICNWYVAPDYRGYAQPLISMALRHRDFTYLNVSPAPHTWPIVESQGYTRYCSGLFFGLAALKRRDPAVRLEPFDRQRHQALPEAALMARHQDVGCETLVVHRDGVAHGMVFRRFRIRSGRITLPAMFVIHAPQRDLLIAAAGNIGRHFMRRLAPVLVFDADGPVKGLAGHFSARRGRKYFRGPHRPLLCDLGDTEFALFGL